MASKKDVELLEEYEELVALLRELHNDVPILEKQHSSIKQAFVLAQEKLEKTATESGDEIQKKKDIILSEFEKECQKVAKNILFDLQRHMRESLDELANEFRKKCVEISEDAISNVETGTNKFMKEITAKEKELNTALKKVEVVSQQSTQIVEKSKKRTTQTVDLDPQLKDGLHCTGRHLSEEYSKHINKDLFVKRVGRKNARPWNNDFCMFVTEVDNGKIYGDRYKDGELYDEHIGYDLSDFFMIYRGPSEKKILKNLK